MTRTGQIHTLESIIAAILFLTFITTILPNLSGSPAIAPIIEQETRQVLTAHDTVSDLRGPIIDRDMDALRDRLDTTATRRVEVALTATNVTTDRTTFTDRTTATFHVNASTAVRQELRLWYRDATAPNVTVNGDPVANRTGVQDGNHTVNDIAPYTAGGSNTLAIETAGTATVGYTIEITDRLRTAMPPSGVNVYTASYMISGANTTLHPAEVTVFSWQ